MHLRSGFMPGRLRFLCVLGMWADVVASSDAEDSAASASSRSSRPNILFILADDMGYGDAGYLQTGSDHGRLLTPTLDRLANQGVRFTEAYAGAPVCAPSRCTLITGRHSGHCTVRSNGPILGKSDVGIATVLKKAFYKTYLIGKWGLGDVNSTGDPLSKGFDKFYGQTSQMHCHDYYPLFMWQDQQRVDLALNANASDHNCGADRQRCSWSGDLWTARAVAILQEHAAPRTGTAAESGSRPEPFFMYLSYTAPHAGAVGTDGEHGSPVPRISRGPYSGKDQAWGQVEMEYAAAVTEIDTQVGIVLRALEANRLADNTVVMFASDNGASNEGGHDYEFFKSSGALRGFKRSLHEGGHRTALIVRWPSVVPPNTVTSQQFAFYDLMATAAEIAGLDPVGDLPELQRDGISMVPMLQGRGVVPRDFIYHEYCAPNEYRKGWGQAVRVGNWSAVCTGRKPVSPSDVPVCEVPLLYDLFSDPSQETDVAGSHQDVVAHILTLMRREHVPGDYCGSALDGTVLVDPSNFEGEADKIAFQLHQTSIEFV